MLALVKSTATPILQTDGDHNVIFPVKNWYALKHQLPTHKLLTFPRDGHGPHHQHPEASAERIATFVRVPSRTQKALLEEGSSVVMT